MSIPDLIEFTRDVAATIPHDPDESFVFHPDTVPPLPERLRTNDLIVTLGEHYYDNFPVEHHQAYASKAIYGALGIVTAGVLLQADRDHVDVELTHDRSEAKILRLAFAHPTEEDATSGLQQVPALYRYWPDAPAKHPWHDAVPPNPFELPSITLGDRNGFRHGPGRDGLDVVTGFGTAEGTARMVGLFLDISRDVNERFEFPLECEGGFRGVAPLSAEFRLWLPGSDYPGDDLFP